MADDEKGNGALFMRYEGSRLEDKDNMIYQLLKDTDWSYPRIARKVNVSKSTVLRRSKEWGMRGYAKRCM